VKDEASSLLREKKKQATSISLYAKTKGEWGGKKKRKRYIPFSGGTGRHSKDREGKEAGSLRKRRGEPFYTILLKGETGEPFIAPEKGNERGK